MAIEIKRFFNTVIRTATANNLSTGAVVRITRTDNNLNGNNYYVKVLSSTSFSLYYDSSLTKIVGTDSLNITSSATIIPLFVTSLTYSFSTGGGETSTTTFAFSTSITTNIQNFNLNTALVAAGWNGTSVVAATIAIDAGIYIWSDSTSLAALTVTSLPASSTVSILNNGFIIGKGGGSGDGSQPGAAGINGGPAISLGTNVTLTNNSYIAGGGGGGGGYGGGGAGGGNGGNGPSVAGGTGGAPGSSGGNGTIGFGENTCGGGGGGRILPGSGGAGATGIGTGVVGSVASQGGGAGGGGGGGTFLIGPSTLANLSSGGGGGWGAAGGTGSRKIWGPNYLIPTYGSGGSANNGGNNGTQIGAATPIILPGGTGGRAISLNGFTVTYITTGTLYGAVS
jgi:hypothetical protein